jgi:hypothetical protein
LVHSTGLKCGDRRARDQKKMPATAQQTRKSQLSSSTTTSTKRAAVTSSANTLSKTLWELLRAYGGDIRVKQLDIPKQMELIAHWRAEGLADSTIDRKLRALWPAFDRAARWQGAAKPKVIEVPTSRYSREHLVAVSRARVRNRRASWRPARAEMEPGRSNARVGLPQPEGHQQTSNFAQSFRCVLWRSPRLKAGHARHARPEGQGSRTGAKYIHLKPSYLADVTMAKS